jgi:hypothetical protein
MSDIHSGPIALVNGNRYILPVAPVADSEEQALAILGFDLNSGTLTATLESRLAGPFGATAAPFVSGFQAVPTKALATPASVFSATENARADVTGLQLAITISVQTGAPRVFVNFASKRA